MREVKNPHRSTYNQLVKLVEAPFGTSKELTGQRYQTWLFARDIGLLHERDDGKIELTNLGKQFKEADATKRRDIFRSTILKNESFSAIWQRVRLRAQENRTKRISRDSIEEILKNVTGVQTPKMVNLHTGTVLNWATSAGLLERDTKTREGYYEILAASFFGPLVSERPKVFTEEFAPTIKDFDYLKELSLIVYDLLGEPKDKEALLLELQRISERWATDSSLEGPTSAYKQIIANEIMIALELQDRRLLEMLSKTLRIVRKGGLLQSTLEEYEKH
jgi:hypothetical protein